MGKNSVTIKIHLILIKYMPQWAEHRKTKLKIFFNYKKDKIYPEKRMKQ